MLPDGLQLVQTGGRQLSAIVCIIVASANWLKRLHTVSDYCDIINLKIVHLRRKRLYARPKPKTGAEEALTRAIRRDCCAAIAHPSRFLSVISRRRW